MIFEIAHRTCHFLVGPHTHTKMKVECPHVLKRVLPLAGKKITEAISKNPVTKPFAVSVNIHRMPWRKFSRVIL